MPYLCQLFELVKPILDNANKEKNFIYCQRDVALP